ncbi:pentapeptide repeat-containing protein [Sedimentitalea todarodis]|uniref:Pentapeptide repeat-containing protein n=1 Tax=Sedimentitalea todarodis TaxID=1631240 RepID=A0ABU3VCI1_9RHOB|nr:pentapeptide repeat-containing protein [Sedimentitalea todarodis]MDU9003449.1 pentapeptide repeat-containing protein [Sedimentitalea todarodis]
MSETPDPVARINALTTNARNTWFVLLGVLVFVAITLMGVQHIDFYGVDRATALPLVNVSVPTWLFFYAAPLLITAVYGYFHLYLIRLWDALGAADPIINKTPLGDAITPWLVSDVALKLRATYRDPTCITPRAMEIPNAIWNTLFAWIAGPAILGWLWWASMPARDWVMTGLAGTCLLFALAFGYASVAMMRRRMASQDRSTHRVWQDTEALPVLLFLLIPAIALLTHSRTVESSDWITLAPINLTGAALVEKPADWLPYDIARADFLSEWCAREKPACDPPTAAVPGLISRLPGLLFGKDDTPALPTPASDPPAAFETEWKTRRTAALAALKKPRWSAPNADPPDFRNAILSETSLSGADLGGAQMQEANLSEAQMQGANLWQAQMQEAVLRRAQMQEANLRWAQMQGANLSEAQMQGANLRWAQMQGANLSEAQMQGANLRWAQMQGANLSWAQMQGANLSWAQMQGADLSGAQMQEANLSWALLTGTLENPNIASATNLSASINNGGALRFVDLRSAKIDALTDWRNAFFDGSVLVPNDRKNQIGQPCLWRWIAKNPDPLPDKEYFGRWRGWLTLYPAWDDDYWSWLSSVPKDWRDVAAIPPPPGCIWHSDPLPGAVSQE